MTFTLPTVVKLAERLLVEIEQAVRHFARYHKYTTGTALREQAMQVTVLAHRAWRDRARQGEWIERLKWALDDLNIRMQLGSQIRAFCSFAQFESLARLAKDLGRQVGGWHKMHHPKAQNAASDVSRQRGQILSSPTASCTGANP